MARIESRMTPGAEYAERQRDQMQQRKELRQQDEAKAERVREQAREDDRQEQARIKEAKKAELEERQAERREENKGANLDKMA